MSDEYARAREIAGEIARKTGASAEVVSAILARALAADAAQRNRQDRRARVAMNLLRAVATPPAAPDLGAYPRELSVPPGFRPYWRAQRLLRGEEPAPVFVFCCDLCGSADRKMCGYGGRAGGEWCKLGDPAYDPRPEMMAREEPAA